jgi:hypothetical protein
MMKVRLPFSAGLAAKTFLLATLLAASPLASAEPESSKEGEAVAERYALALVRLDVVPMVEELHPDIHEYFHATALGVVEGTTHQTERSAWFKTLGVTDMDELQALPPKTATVRWYEWAFPSAPKVAREASMRARIKVLGSLTEEDTVHVLYRITTELDLENGSRSVEVPSVVTLQRSEGRLKVSSTTQLETMKAKLTARVYERSRAGQ